MAITDDQMNAIISRFADARDRAGIRNLALTKPRLRVLIAGLAAKLEGDPEFVAKTAPADLRVGLETSACDKLAACTQGKRGPAVGDQDGVGLLARVVTEVLHGVG